MLNGEEIAARGLILGAHDDKLRRSTYDMTIGTIMFDDGKQSNTHRLRPQEMVTVVSAERVKLPNDLACYAMPKTSLCNEGLLALSTGIVDPGYEGHLSSVLINFGSTTRTLKSDMEFLRLTFHDLTKVEDEERFKSPLLLTTAEFFQERRQMTKELPEEFLDLNEHIAEIAQKSAGLIVSRQTVFLARVGAFLAASAIVAAIVLVFVTPYVEDYIPTSGAIKSDVANELRLEELVPLQQELDRLEDRVLDLEADVRNEPE